MVKKIEKPLIVITGASSGIGKETARVFSKAGYPLLLLARRVALMKDLDLPNTICEQVDITDYEYMSNVIRKAENKFGFVDGIINNAGVLFLGKIADQDPEEWKSMLDVNLLGTLYGIQSVLKNMMERRNGTIINISSISGIKNFSDQNVYSATKSGVRALTEGLRSEVAEYGVRCISICPGVVENTEILQNTKANKLIQNVQIEKTKMGKIISPSEVADVVLFTYEQPQHVCIREIVMCSTGQIN